MMKTVAVLLAVCIVLGCCLLPRQTTADSATDSSPRLTGKVSTRTPVLLIYGLQLLVPFHPEDLWKGMAEELSGSSSGCNLRSSAYPYNLWYFPAQDAEHHDVYISDYCGNDCLPTLLPLAYYTENLKREIDYVKELEGCSKIDLVGHSMGGLAARRYIESVDLQGNHYRNNIRDCVMIGTPNRIISPSLMLSFSGFADLVLLRSINRETLVQARGKSADTRHDVSYYTIAGEFKVTSKGPQYSLGTGVVGTDGLVWTSSVGLAGARKNYVVRYIDHTSLIQTRVVYTAVRKILDGKADSVPATIMTNGLVSSNNWFYNLRSKIIDLLCLTIAPA